MALEEPRSPTLYFDPDRHPENTLKVFNEFCGSFVMRYNALYPDPPKTSMDAAIARWKIIHTTADIPDPKPDIGEYDALRDTWRSKDMVTQFLDYSPPNDSRMTGSLHSPLNPYAIVQHGNCFGNTWLHITNQQKTQPLRTFTSGT